jgi:hypothetical protein
MTFDSVVQSDSSPPINECCQIKSKFLHLKLTLGRSLFAARKTTEEAGFAPV